MKSRIRIAAIGTLCISAIALLGTAAAVPVSASSTATGYSASVSAGGLNLSLFGEKLIGGNSTACVNQGTETVNTGSKCNGQTAPYANATGTGTVLTSSGLYTPVTATANADNQNISDGTAADPKCSPVTTGGAQGADGVTLNLGVSCAYANASVDGSGNPTTQGYGEAANLDVDLAGILSAIGGASPAKSLCTQSSGQLIGALLNGVCEVLGPIAGTSSSTPASGLFSGVEQALQNIYDVVTKDIPAETLTVTVGAADSSICPGTITSAGCSPTNDGTVTATSAGSTLDVGVLPGVGCTDGTTLLTCATNEVTNLSNEANNPTAAPLIEIEVGPATCTAVRDPSTGNWTSTDYASLVDVHLNIPGDNINLDIPGTSGTGQTIAAGTPLQSTIRVAEGTAAPVGDTASCNGDSLTLSLLENSMFPGGSSTAGTGGAIFVTLGQTALTAANNNAAPAIVTAPLVTPAVTPAPAAAAPTVAGVTTVHTGEFWAGSLPIFLVSGMGLAGLMLIARRRVFSVARALTPFTRHSAYGSAGGPPPGPASGTSSVPPPVSGPARRQSL